MPHYFSPSPDLPSNRRTITVRLGPRRLDVETDRGVFSGERLDPGTTVLLDAAPAPATTGTLLDLGCGWGPITLSLAQRAPGARILAVDVNERALDLTRANAQRHGAGNVEAYLPEDLLAAEPDLTLTEIWSNPPIRIGKAALHDILTTWLARLAPGGQAHLVVQRNLGSDSLHRWMAETLGRDVARTASVNGYRVLTVR